MHMANELLSVPVAAGTLGIAAAGLGFICRKARTIVTSDKLALMGILGAFIFAAQMVTFQLPAMPGTSGHMVGAVLLAIILGPNLGAIVISSVVIIQCLIFQDGGLLALGCNIINMALVPSYLGYFIYKSITNARSTPLRIYIGAALASVISIEAGASLVPIEAALSGVLVVPFSTFLITMLGVHLLIGTIEGIITVAVLSYLQQVRPDILAEIIPGKIRLTKKTVLATFLIFAVIIAGGLSLLASDLPDGLEWAYAQRPDQPDFSPAVENKNPKINAVDEFQAKYSPMPDYSTRTAPIGEALQQQKELSTGWTSFAGVIGSLLTMAFIYLFAWGLKKTKRQEELNSN